MTGRIERVFQIYFLTALFSTSGIDALLVVTVFFFSLECAQRIGGELLATAYTSILGITGR